MITKLIVNFFILWKIRLGLKGGGVVIRAFAPMVKMLRNYPIKLSEGQTIHADMRDSGIGWLFYKYSGIVGEENGLLKAINALSTNSSVIWDIGSNCGILSYAIAQSKPIKSLHFFEPNPIVFKIARNALAPFSNTHGLNIGISDSEREMSLIIPNKGLYSKIATLESEKVNRSGDAVTVQCKTGDQLIENETVLPPDIIKIDVEGHEMAVINGLHKYIRNKTPIILFEHISLSDEEVMKILPENYVLYSINDQSGKLTKGFNRSLGHNSALIPNSSNQGIEAIA